MSSKIDERCFKCTVAMLPQFSPKYEQDSLQAIRTCSTNFKQLVHSHYTKAVQSAASVKQEGTNVYTGISGIIYMYLYLYLKSSHKEQTNNLQNDDHLANALYFVNKLVPHLPINNFRERDAAFIGGLAGSFSLAAVVNHLYGERLLKQNISANIKQQQQLQSKAEMYADEATRHIELLKQIYTQIIVAQTNDAKASNELLFGRSGFIYAAMFVNSLIVKPSSSASSSSSTPVIPLEMINETARIILKHATVYQVKQHQHQQQAQQTVKEIYMWNWHDKEYLGAAHGVAGIIHTLLTALPFITLNEQQKTRLYATCEWFATSSQAQASNKNFLSRPEGSDHLVQWCHGAPGVIPLLLKYNSMFNSTAAMKAAKEASELVFEKGLLKKGFGICHGIAGNMHCLLQMYHATSDAKYWRMVMYYANTIANATYQQSLLLKPDCPYSLFEGLAGTVVALENVLEFGAKGNSLPHFPAFHLLQ